MDTGDVELVRRMVADATQDFEVRLQAIAERAGLNSAEVREIVRMEMAQAVEEMHASMVQVEAAAEAQVEAAVEHAESAIEDAVEAAVEPVTAAVEDVEEAVESVEDAIEHPAEAVEHVEAAAVAPVDALDNAIEEATTPNRGGWWHSPVFPKR